ncbi:CocE/NonD family hydrolase [Kribbella endophytica]
MTGSLPLGPETLSEFFACLKGELKGSSPDLEVRIPMRDGVELAGAVYLPTDQKDAVPAIVQITPYDKSSATWSREARWFADRGYASVVVDVRGILESGGDFHWFVHDGEDGYDVVEWVAEQSWCDGSVGTTGISYMGWVQWALAAERPPHLRCMISSAAAGRWMQDIPYTWGILQSYFPMWLYGIQQQTNPRPATHGETVPELLSTWPLVGIGDKLGLEGPSWGDLTEHSSYDEFWKALRFDTSYAEIDVPCLHVAGWFDLENLTGAMHHYEQMINASPAASDQTLLVGPWSHAGVRYPHSTYDGTDFGPAASVDMNELHLRWFDKWLRGDEDRWTLPSTAVFDTGQREWKLGEEWTAAQRSLHLAGGRGLSESPDPVPGQASYRFDPSVTPVPRFDFRAYPATDYPFDETAVDERDDVLTWTTEVLDRPLTLTGWSRLIMYAATDGTDTDWHVKLTDVDPDGRSVRVSSGCLRASCRTGLDSPEPVQPDVPTEYSVELWPAHHTFQPGHRLRVQLASSDFPWFTLNSNRFGHPMTTGDPRPCVNTVLFGGTHPSRIVLGTTPLEP